MKKSIFLVRSTGFYDTMAMNRASLSLSFLDVVISAICWERNSKSNIVNNIVRILNFYGNDESRWVKMFSFVRFNFFVLFSLIRNRPDYVQVFDFYIAPVCFLYTSFFRKKLIYDIRDPFAFSFIFSKIIKRIVWKIDLFIIKNSAGVIVPLEERLRYLCKYRDIITTAVIHNTCNDDYIITKNSWNVLDQNYIHIGFLGYLVESRGAFQLISLAKKYPEDVKLHIAGRIQDERILSLIKESVNIVYYGLLNHNDALKLLSNLDFCSLFYDPSVPVNISAAPNKFYESLMLDTPVIVCKGSALQKIVEDNNLGVSLNYDCSIKSFFEVISGFKKDRGRLRTFYLNNFSFDNELLKYKDFYIDLGL